MNLVEGYIFRTLYEMGATSVDFVIILIGLFFAAAVFFVTRAHTAKSAELNALIKEHNETHHKHRQLEARLAREALAEAVALIDNRIKGVDERYYRQDALQYGMAKVIEMSSGVKLINGSADGDGNYTLNREIESGRV